VTVHGSGRILWETAFASRGFGKARGKKEQTRCVVARSLKVIAPRDRVRIPLSLLRRIRRERDARSHRCYASDLLSGISGSLNPRGIAARGGSATREEDRKREKERDSSNAPRASIDRSIDRSNGTESQKPTAERSSSLATASLTTRERVRGRRFENAIEPSERWQIARARADDSGTHYIYSGILVRSPRRGGA